MRRNVELNGLGPEKTQVLSVEGVASIEAKQSKPHKADLGKVRVNEGDAW